MEKRNEIIREFFAFNNHINRGNLKANTKTKPQYLIRRSLQANELELIAQVIPNTGKQFYLMATLKRGTKWEAVENSDFLNLIEFFTDFLNEKYRIEALSNFTEQKGIEIGEELRGIFAALFIPRQEDP